MPPIDPTLVSAHVVVDRMTRINIIEKTVGWGEPVVHTADRKSGGDATITLTSTGVLVVRAPNNMIITAWIASETQAMGVYRRATGKSKMPDKLFWQVQYNNNTTIWKKRVA